MPVPQGRIRKARIAVLESAMKKVYAEGAEYGQRPTTSGKTLKTMRKTLRTLLADHYSPEFFKQNIHAYKANICH